MNTKVSREIRRIAETIPEDLVKNLLVLKPSYNATLEMIDKALAEPDLNPKLRRRLTLIKDSGMLDAKELVTDAAIEEKLEAWWDEEIQLAIKEKRLPKPKKGSGSLEEIKKKGQQYARRNNRKSLEGHNEGDAQAAGTPEVPGEEGRG